MVWKDIKRYQPLEKKMAYSTFMHLRNNRERRTTARRFLRCFAITVVSGSNRRRYKIHSTRYNWNLMKKVSLK